MGNLPELFPILVAEDEATLRNALAEFLQGKGYEVALAANGREALDFLEERAYALVITDLVMPEADGLTVLRAARQRHPGTLVVIMTGYASLNSAIGAIREGAYDYLCKPFKLQEIDILVANAARVIHLHQENQELLRRLEDLTHKVRDLEVIRSLSGKERGGPGGRESRGVLPLNLLNSGAEDRARRLLADLERLQSLYRQDLLTKEECHRIKQRLLI